MLMRSDGSRKMVLSTDDCGYVLLSKCWTIGKINVKILGSWQWECTSRAMQQNIETNVKNIHFSVVFRSVIQS